MDIQLKKKPFLVRHWRMACAAVALIALLGITLRSMLGPQRLSVSERQLGLCTVAQSDFSEYLEQDGTVAPLNTLQLTSRVAGFVSRTVAEDGALLRAGDTILVLSNPELENEISEQEETLQKQLLTYTEQEIEMQQKSILLRKQVLQNDYELRRIAESYKLAQEEAAMGIKSKAELDLARQEYEYKQRSAALEQENLRQDSASTALRLRLIQANREQDIRRADRVRRKRDDLILRAPIAGQLSGLDITPGQQVQPGAALAELKVPNQYKVSISAGEYYAGRIQAGQQASATVKGQEYAMRVRHVVPEIRNHSFSVDLVFTDSLPSGLRLGQSLRARVQLGGSSRALVVRQGNFASHTGGEWVFRVVPGERRAVRVPIRLGRQNPRLHEVLEGLSEGDEIVTTGYADYGKASEIAW